MPWQHAVGGDELDDHVKCLLGVDSRGTEALLELCSARRSRIAEDEVVDVVRKYVTSPETRRVRQRSDSVEAERVLGLEVGVADLEREVAGVRAEEVQLLERRVARGAREAAARWSACRRRPPGGTASPTDPEASVKSRVGQSAFRLVARVVDPAAELERDVRPGQLFVEERRDAASDRRAATAPRRRRRRTARFSSQPPTAARQPAGRPVRARAGRARSCRSSNRVPTSPPSSSSCW